jgi:hypothetical protein
MSLGSESSNESYSVLDGISCSVPLREERLESHQRNAVVSGCVQRRDTGSVSHSDEQSLIVDGAVGPMERAPARDLFGMSSTYLAGC